MRLFQKYPVNLKTVSLNILVAIFYILLAKLGLYFTLKPRLSRYFGRQAVSLWPYCCWEA